MVDELRQILADADARAGRLDTDAGSLAARVRRASRRRRNARSGAAAGGALALLLAVLPFLRTAPTNDPVAVGGPKLTEAQVASLRAEIDSLRGEAEHSERMVRLLNSAQARPKPTLRPQAALDPATELLLERDRAAAVLEYDADRLARDERRRESAVLEYHRLVELFPTTPSAERARKRIQQIRS